MIKNIELINLSDNQYNKSLSTDLDSFYIPDVKTGTYTLLVTGADFYDFEKRQEILQYLTLDVLLVHRVTIEGVTNLDGLALEETSVIVGSLVINNPTVSVGSSHNDADFWIKEG